MQYHGRQDEPSGDERWRYGGYMMSRSSRPDHEHRHAFSGLNPAVPEGLVVPSRRNMLKAGMAGLAGLGLPDLLRHRAKAAEAGRPIGGNKAVILLWMAGGPSQIDTWDPKPDRPLQNRGPFGIIPTKLPGVSLCEHLPKQAAMLDKFTILRSVDCRHSNHEPNKVLQTGNLEAEPRLGPAGDMYPAIGSVVARHLGANRPGMPPYVAFQTSRSHIAYGGRLGRGYDPFIANGATKLPIYTNVGEDTGRSTGADFFRLPAGLTQERLLDRRALLSDLDRLRREIDRSGAVEAMDRHGREAVEMLVGRRAQAAFDLSREDEAVRDRYGKHLWCQQALLARRLVEAGVAFVTIDLSYHPASGTWDNHGDNIPPYGGISKGLKPLLPIFDHLITSLVSDLGERGLTGRRAGDRHGRVRPDADDGHPGEHRRAEPLAERHVDGDGRRRTPARAGDRGDRQGWRVHQGPPRDARRPGGDDLPPHGGAARRHLP